MRASWFPLIVAYAGYSTGSPLGSRKQLGSWLAELLVKAAQWLSKEELKSAADNRDVAPGDGRLREARTATVAVLTPTSDEFLAATAVFLPHPPPSPLVPAGYSFTCQVVRVPSDVSPGHSHTVLIVKPDTKGPQSVRMTAKDVRNFAPVDTIIISGIAAGIPTDVRLGDIVVSTIPPSTNHGIDRGNKTPKSRNDFANMSLKPAVQATAAHDVLLQDAMFGRASWTSAIDKAVEVLGDSWSRPSPETDHSPVGSADTARQAGVPKVHGGKIFSHTQYMQHAEKRDALGKILKALAIDQEAYWLAEYCDGQPVGYFIVRGISDYADNHHEQQAFDAWRRYAAIAAAAYTRAVIQKSRPSTLINERNIESHVPPTSEKHLLHPGIDASKNQANVSNRPGWFNENTSPHSRDRHYQPEVPQIKARTETSTERAAVLVDGIERSLLLHEFEAASAFADELQVLLVELSRTGALLAKCRLAIVRARHARALHSDETIPADFFMRMLGDALRDLDE